MAIRIVNKGDVATTKNDTLATAAAARAATGAPVA
jgi:hypothetical protein